jgi:hypothetical protein
VSGPSLATVERARRDPAVFAEVLVGEALWPHQREIAASRARYRVICAGRRAGKTRIFGVLSLHEAFKAERRKVLIVSVGDTASKRMFADIASMAARAPLLAGSVADETKSLLTLTNGSSIECVPQSMGQVRSAEADLLVVDEAGFVAQGIWESAEPVVVARAGSRVLLCSTPWGGTDHFFRALWRQGMERPDGKVASWHWPSRVSPMVDEEFLADIKGRSSPSYYEREYEAVWLDEQGAYFTTAELEGACEDYELVDPADIDAARACGGVVGGVDWGGRRDAHALAVVGARGFDERGRARYWLPFLEERFDLSFDGWIDRLLEIGEPFRFQRLASETNGIGMMPSEALAREFSNAGLGYVVEGVTTTARLKEDCFGLVRLLLQQRRLGLPRFPALLKQLAALQYEQTEGGLLKIAVPEAGGGHDDLAMALCLAFSMLQGVEMAPLPPSSIYEMEDFDPDLDDFHIGGVV